MRQWAGLDRDAPAPPRGAIRVMQRWARNKKFKKCTTLCHITYTHSYEVCNKRPSSYTSKAATNTLLKTRLPQTETLNAIHKMSVTSTLGGVIVTMTTPLGFTTALKLLLNVPRSWWANRSRTFIAGAVILSCFHPVQIKINTATISWTRLTYRFEVNGEFSG